MAGDVLLVAGLVICSFAITGVISAWADDRPRWPALGLGLLGCVSVAASAVLLPEGLSAAYVPTAFVGVIRMIAF